MAALSGEQVAQIFHAAGFRGEDLVKMVGISRRESSWDPAAHRSDRPKDQLSGDRGLVQVNYSWDSRLKAAGIIDSPADLFDPVVNAKAAYFIYQQSGGNFKAWNMAPGGWNANGDPFYGVNLNTARQAVNSAQTQGLLGQDYAGTTATGQQGAVGGVPGSGTTGPSTNLPSDAQVVAMGPYVFALFQPAPGVYIHFGIRPGAANYDQSKVRQMSADEWMGLRSVDGGLVEELGTVTSTFGSFSGFWSSVITQVVGLNNPAKDDPEVMRVLAEFAARPDMTGQELQGKLQATQWFQTRTSSELEWNGLSQAEQAKRREATAAQMLGQIQQFAGGTGDMNDPRVQNHLEQIASGKMGIGAWTEQVVKAQAAQDPNSPWALQLRNQQLAAKQPGVDMENTAQKVKDLARRWGVPMSEQTAQDWGKRIVNNDASEADVLDQLKQQSQVMYAGKPPDMETLTWASPWMETYSRVMEKQGDLFDPKVQSALSSGTQVWEFEQSLKRSDEWLGTKNAEETLTSVIDSVGRRMGFSKG